MELELQLEYFEAIDRAALNMVKPTASYPQYMMDVHNITTRFNVDLNVATEDIFNSNILMES
jgi:hypothetical protein